LSFGSHSGLTQLGGGLEGGIKREGSGGQLREERKRDGEEGFRTKFEDDVMCFMIRVGKNRSVSIFSNKICSGFNVTQSISYLLKEWLAKHLGTVRWLWPTASRVRR
jgi:hypothetical protein